MRARRSDDEIESSGPTPCPPPQEWRKCGRGRVEESRVERACEEEEEVRSGESVAGGEWESLLLG